MPLADLSLSLCECECVSRESCMWGFRAFSGDGRVGRGRGGSVLGFGR